MPAYACEVTVTNINAILSELGRKADRDEAQTLITDWLEEHGEGWFLRDESSVLDCNFFVPSVFFEMYAFDRSDPGEGLFRRVVKL